jgi:predicted TPR repeat methyltransferase
MPETPLSRRLERVYGARDLQDLEHAYDEWAQQYDEEVSRLGYLLRAVSTGYIGRFIPPDSRVIDAGAGTGLIGAYLRIMGFQDLTAIDLSSGMLARAHARGCYRDVHQMVLGEALDFESNSFQHGYAVGVFTEGHAPPESFDELARIIRPDGYFVFSIRDDVYRDRGYREKINEMVDRGSWRQAAASGIFQPYQESKPEVRSRVFVYQMAS